MAGLPSKADHRARGGFACDGQLRPARAIRAVHIVLGGVFAVWLIAACTALSDSTAPNQEAEISEPDSNSGQEELDLSENDDGLTPETSPHQEVVPIAVDVGNPIFAMSAGNLRLRPQTSLAIGFMAPETSQVDSVSFVIKYDDQRPGYHSGTCGQVTVSLAPAGTDGNPSDERLGQIEIVSPCEGPRTIGWLTTQIWPTPIPLEKGLTYFLIFDNPDPDTNNWVSINQLFDRTGLPGPEDGASSWLLARGDSYYSGDEGSGWGHTPVLRQHQPVFEFSTIDGSVFGQSFVGVRRSLTLKTTDMARQRFMLTQTLQLHELRVRPIDPSAEAELDYRLVGPNNEILASGVLLNGDDGWLQAPLQLKLLPEVSYTLEIQPRSGIFTFYPVYLATHDDWRSLNEPPFTEPLEVSLSGGSWKEFNTAIRHDLPLLLSGTVVEDTVDSDQAAVTPTSEVPAPARPIVVLGDSLVSSSAFEAGFEEALAPEGHLVAIDYRPGRTVEAATTEIEALESDLEGIVVSLGINGSSTAEQFEANVRDFLAKVDRLSPDTPIYWIDLAALATRHENIVIDRVEPRNQVLQKLESEGLLSLIGWNLFVLDSPGIFAADGVHHHGNEDQFGQFVGSEIGNILAGMS